MTFRERLTKYKAQREIKLRGGLNCIPFSEFLPELSLFMPGIIKGVYYAITAFTNVGKTPLVKSLFVNIPYYYYKVLQNTPNRFKLKILYFCLEETKDQFIDSLVLSELYSRYNISLDINDLNSISAPIDTETLKKLASFEAYFNEMFEVLTVIDTVTSTAGIMDVIKRYAYSNGTVYNDEGEEAELDKQGAYYVPNDPSEHVIIITDHVNILSVEGQNDSLHKAIHRHSTKNMLHKCIRMFNYTVVDVHQQAAEGESAEYNKFNRNECSLTTLGDNKMVARNYMVVIALDMPQRYGVTEHAGYKLGEFGNRADRYRSIKLLKNRYGRSGIRKGVWFTPQAMEFQELPNSKLIDYKQYGTQ
jgi:hypothetical protein